MNFKGPYKAAYLTFPDVYNFKTDVGKIKLETDEFHEIDLTINSLYHFFIIQIVAECQLKKNKFVDPREVFHYLQQLHLKWIDYSGYKKIQKIEVLKNCWSNRISLSDEEEFVVYKSVDGNRQRTKEKKTLKRNSIFIKHYDVVNENEITPRKKVFFGINIFDNNQIFFQQKLLDDLIDWVPPEKPKSIWNLKKYSEPIWPLKYGEQVLDIEHMEGCYFRRSGPFAVDIEKGFVSKPIEYDIVKSAFDKEDLVLLYGEKASGKSVLARILAYEWMKTNQVAFLELNQTIISYDKLFDRIISFSRGNQKALIIIEDAHLQLNLVNELIILRPSIQCKILITSRSIAKSGLQNKYTNNSTKLNRIEICPLNNNEIIIESFFKFKNWELSYKIRRNLLTISKRNLWVLSYALMSIHDINNPIIDENLILTKVKEDLEDLSFINTLYPRILMTLSILSRFEIPTDIRFIYHIFYDYPNALIEDAIKKLISMGEIISIEEDNYHYLILPHSVLADLYFNFTKYPEWEEETVYSNETMFISKYLISEKAANGLLILNPPEILDLPNIIDVLNIIDKKKLINRILRSNQISELLSYLLHIIYKNNQTGQDLWNKINKEELSKMILDISDVKGVIFYLEIITKTEFEMKEEFWTYIDKKKFADNISNSNDISVIDSLMNLISHNYSDNVKELWKLIDKEKISKIILNKDYLYYTGNYIKVIFNANYDDGKELWEKINKKELAFLISSDDIVYSSLCLQKILQANITIGYEIWDIVKEDFIINIKFDNNIWHVIRSIQNILDADLKLGQKILNIIKKETLIEKVASQPNIDEEDKQQLLEIISKEFYKNNIKMNDH